MIIRASRVLFVVAVVMLVAVVSGAFASPKVRPAVVGSAVRVDASRPHRPAATRHLAATALIVDDDRVQCPTADYTSIQAAVDAASAGDTITVCPGQYAENVSITKTLTLLGPGAGTSRAASCSSDSTDAVVSATTGFSVSGSGTTLSGFVLSSNSTAGVVTDPGGSGYTITDNVFTGNADGIRLGSSGASTSVVSNNAFCNQSRSGIHSEGITVHNVQIANNSFASNSGWGMFLGQFAFGNPVVYVDSVTIYGNSSNADNRFIEIPASTNVTIDGNTGTGDQAGIFLANNNTGTHVTNNTLTNGYTGIYVSSIGPFGGLSNSGLLISGNSVSGMRDHGISTEAGASMLNSTISNNTVSNDAANGIWIADGSTGNTITGNTLSGNAVYDCRDDTNGSGTAGTANTWTLNNGLRESRTGLCVPVNHPPTAAFTLTPSSGDTTTVFQFDGSGSSDPDNDTLTYQWDFGDGTTGSGQQPTHTYATTGDKVVTLVVNDGHVDSAPATHTVSVTQPVTTTSTTTTTTTSTTTTTTPPTITTPGNAPPYPDFSYSPRPPHSGETIHFLNRSTDPEGDPMTFTWDFGDGGRSTDANPTHVFATAATYRVRLNASDGKHAPRSTTVDLVVEPAVPMKHQLRVTVTGNGGVTSTPSGIDCGSTCSASFDQGTQVTLEARPLPGQTFAGWDGACSGTDTRCSVSMSSDSSVTAAFKQRTDIVTLTAHVSGEGTVSTWEWGVDTFPVHCGERCVEPFVVNDSVHVVAIPATGYVLNRWKGACAGQRTWCVLKMSKSRVTTAVFVKRSGRR